MLACLSINWIDLIQIFLMRSLLVDSFEFDFSISKFVTFSISSILLQTIYSKNLRRLMILRKSLKRRTLMIEWTFSSIVCVFSVSTAEEELSSILIFEYFEKSQKIVVYLFTLRKLSEMSLKKFNKFKKKLSDLNFREINFFVEIQRMFSWDEWSTISKSDSEF
jgi:hypothetical protein